MPIIDSHLIPTRDSLQDVTEPSDDSLEDFADSTWGWAEGDVIVPGLQAWYPLGRGRRFEMWLAWSVARWAAVTVKVPRRDTLADVTLAAKAVNAMAREARTVGGLAHPFIQRILESNLGPGTTLPHLVFEYVEGPTLDDALEDGPLAGPDALRLGLQVASALAYLHGRGVVHMDLKPANLALRDGRAVLLDFDIALPIGGLRSEFKARGSAPYMAPEQIRCEPASPSMDLWALGAVCYEALTAERPFLVTEGRLYPQLAGRCPPPSALLPECAGAADEAVRTLTDPDPDRRPPSAWAALELLRNSLPAGEDGLWPAWADRALPEAPPLRGSDIRVPDSAVHPPGIEQEADR